MNAPTLPQPPFAGPSELAQRQPPTPPTATEPSWTQRADRGFGGGETALSRYLNEIGQIELLSAQEEIDLAMRIQSGDREARERMINANLRLVVKFAHDFERFGVPLLDLISEGNIGLMKAVDRFDPCKGVRFATYGAFWIKQFIRRALTNQSKTIRLPAHMVTKLYQMHRAERSLLEELGREPTDEEVGEAVGLTPARVAELRTAAIRPASLEAPLGGEDSGHLADVVEDEGAENPASRFAEKAEVGMLHDLVTKLPPREAKILRARFGLDDGSQKTLDEISEKFGVTRERIRQIQDSALRKLRKMCRRLEGLKAGNSVVQSFAQ